MAGAINTTADPLQQSFPVTSISRADLLRQPGLTDAEVRQLDDAAMIRIDARLKDYFVDTGFWEALAHYAYAELAGHSKTAAYARDR